MEKKSSTRTRKLDRELELSTSDERRIKRLLGR